MKPCLYQEVRLQRDIPEAGLKAGDTATLIDYLTAPNGGEEGALLELDADKYDPFVVSVPLSSILSIQPDNSAEYLPDAARMVPSKPKLTINTWVTASWADYLAIVEDPVVGKAKGYYFNGQMRVETRGVGPEHGSDNTLIILAIGLFCKAHGIANKGLTNCSYRQTGLRAAQPDISYYIGDSVAKAPESSSIANLDDVSPPDLAIEIADACLEDDLGKKRLLYEEMGIAEYWVVNIETVQIIAFRKIGAGSQRIKASQVLPGVDIATLEEALLMHQTMDVNQVLKQLLAKF
jgi:Uma2 family endonuclease